MDEKKFHSWLVGHQKLNNKSANDVLSRVRRVTKIIATGRVPNAEEAFSHLDNSDNFKLIPSSVRSQLRRAVKLYNQYKIFSQI